MSSARRSPHATFSLPFRTYRQRSRRPELNAAVASVTLAGQEVVSAARSRQPCRCFCAGDRLQGHHRCMISSNHHGVWSARCRTSRHTASFVVTRHMHRSGVLQTTTWRTEVRSKGSSMPRKSGYRSAIALRSRVSLGSRPLTPPSLTTTEDAEG